MRNIRFDNVEQSVNNVHIDILEHGHVFADENWNFHHVTSPFNRIYFVLDGSGYVQGTCGKIHLVPGNIYLIPLHSTNSYICDSTMEKFYIHFRIDIFPGIDVFESLDTYSSLPFEKSIMIGLLEKIRHEELSGIFSLKAMLYDAVCKFMELACINLKNLITSTLKYRKVSEYIKVNCSLKLTPDRIADSMDIPVDILTKEFMRDMGYSLKSCIYNAILQHAKEKLLLTDLRIKEIAYPLAFYDEFHFSHFFKKHAGLSPKEYRKKNTMRPRFLT